MNVMMKSVEEQPLEVCIPTGASLDGFTDLEVHYIDPEGARSFVTGEVHDTTYIMGTIPKDDLIGGLWAVWGEGLEPGGTERVTFTINLIILKKGRVS